MAARKVMEYRVLEVAGNGRFTEELNDLVEHDGWRPVKFEISQRTVTENHRFIGDSVQTIYVAFLERPRKG